jgi:hypothetical protein
MRARTKKQLDSIAFAGVLLPRIGFLVWFVVILPRVTS